MLVIKKQGKYLCDFLFKDGIEFRKPKDISMFVHVITGNRNELYSYVCEYGGKIVEIKEGTKL